MHSVCIYQQIENYFYDEINDAFENINVNPVIYDKIKKIEPGLQT